MFIIFVWKKTDNYIIINIHFRGEEDMEVLGFVVISFIVIILLFKNVKKEDEIPVKKEKSESELKKELREEFECNEVIGRMIKRLKCHIDSIECIELNVYLENMQVYSRDFSYNEYIRLNGIVPRTKSTCYRAFYGLEEKHFPLVIPMLEFALFLNDNFENRFRIESDTSSEVQKQSYGESIEDEYVMYYLHYNKIKLIKK